MMESGKGRKWMDEEGLRGAEDTLEYIESIGCRIMGTIPGETVEALRIFKIMCECSGKGKAFTGAAEQLLRCTKRQGIEME